MPSRQRGAPAGISSGLLAVCFLISGVTGLVYELVWMRRLQLVFGSTTYSITTVLAAFMAGLGVGSYLVGRRVDRIRRSGVAIYAYLELGIGLYALLSLPLIGAMEALYSAIQTRAQLGQAGATLLKFVLAFPILALPAGMMGGTLPALVRATVAERAVLARQMGRLYGINTIGAALGTLLTGLVLIEWVGLWTSIVLAASVNLVIGAVVLRRQREIERYAMRSGSEASSASADPEPTIVEPVAAEPSSARLSSHLRQPAVLFCAVSVVLTGLLSMSYEVVWTRLLSLTIGSSTYAFTLVLGLFLIGIAAGSLLFARAARQRQPTAFGLALLLAGLALWVTISIAMIPHLPRLLAALAQLPGLTFGRVLLFEVLFAVAILLVPTLIFGAALPMAMGIVARALGHVGRDVGGVYLANTGGAIVGSVLTGFVLIPLWGTRAALSCGLAANLALAGVGVVAFGTSVPRRVVGLGLIGLLATLAARQPEWPAEVFDAGLGYRLDTVRADNSQPRLNLLQKLRRSPSKLLSREEGVNATITVRQYATGISLLINGKPDASTSADMATQVVLGVVALAANPDARDVNIVGWGSGVTAHATTFFPRVRAVDVIEIEPEVVRASRYFDQVNGSAHQNPKVRIIYDDARSYFLTTRKNYDVIISEPSNPWMMGVSGLFSQDYYRLVRQRLSRGGVFGQWLQLYHIDARSIALVLRTVLRSFAHVQLWYSDPVDVLLVASQQPLRLDLRKLARAYRGDARLPTHMGAYGPGPRPEQLVGCFLLDRVALEKIVARFPDEVLTDDHPVLEFRAVRNLYRPTHPHIRSLWRAKLEHGKLVPHAGLPPATAVAASLRLIRSDRQLAGRVSKWALGRFGTSAEVRLARAKVLARERRFDEALQVASRLPDEGPWRAERALIEARGLLARDQAEQALERLQNMDRARPTARRLYQLRAALAANRLDVAWSAAAALLGGLGDSSDIDALQVQRHQLYRRELHQLSFSSGQWRRAIALINSAEPHASGEVSRLSLLAALQMQHGDTRKAQHTMDQLREFDVLDAKHFELCRRVYRAAGQTSKSAVCAGLAARLVDRPTGTPLWR